MYKILATWHHDIPEMTMGMLADWVRSRMKIMTTFALTLKKLERSLKYLYNTIIFIWAVFTICNHFIFLHVGGGGNPLKIWFITSNYKLCLNMEPGLNHMSSKIHLVFWFISKGYQLCHIMIIFTPPFRCWQTSFIGAGWRLWWPSHWP